MEITVHNQSGKAGANIAVSDTLFGARMNADLVYQVATSQMANRRKVLAHGRTRSEVAGGGKKPWRQKGTGNARHGSIRSPIWVGGGVAHGPTKDVNFKRKVTKSAGRAALASVLSSHLRDGHLAVVDALAVPTGKTRDGVAVLKKVAKALKDYKATDRVLIVLPGTPNDLPTRRAFQNVPEVQVMRALDLNALTILSFPQVIMVADAVTALEGKTAKKK